ncbi:hypothetical protein IQ37_09955 [Chryseobacterium piperi]|uniref:Uncharacterized protein n=1 Tax=Chryseobacterium piperi TaxID=558152 RepID=A0A086BIC9_9FLAO|nr:hypothetical protein [Chryseobacterium piperi]ASW73005.1 hypothetical protein CJF12_01010 [Chryseobacterium piperi]KFF28693.1 hypothetical protein IQ37_09955 [Chryseobacterium piperi]
MNYSIEPKPAKILNLRSLTELNESLYLSRNSDNAYFSVKKTDNNNDRDVFNMQTSNVSIQPIVRPVISTKGKRTNNYQSFVIEPKDKATGIAVIMIKLEENQTFFCNVRILPLSTLADIAEPEMDSKLLTINLEKSKCVLKTDITITASNTGEALYSVHDVDVNAISNLVTPDEIVALKRELEFQGSKLIAHYFQEILEIILNENPPVHGKQLAIPDDYVLHLPNDQLKEMMSANAISGCIALEIIGSNVVLGLNQDWTTAGAFLGYLL